MFTSAFGRPAFKPLVPPTPPASEKALALTEVASGPISAAETGSASHVNWLIICEDAGNVNKTIE